MSIHVDKPHECDGGEYIEQEQERYLRSMIGNELYEWLDRAIEQLDHAIARRERTNEI